MRTFIYLHCGLRVASALPLPELTPGNATARDLSPDVHVILGPPQPAPPADSWEAASDRCEFAVPEAGRFEIRHGRRITVLPAPGVDPALVRLFVLGSAWGAVLHQRSHVPLHAGVTAACGSAFAFCGPSGAGKSSLVAGLLRRGHSLISDDLTRLDVFSDTHPIVWPSVPRLKLAPEALERHGWVADASATDPGMGKSLVSWDGPRAERPTPVRAMFILAWGEPQLTRLRGLEAVRRLVGGATYRPALHETPEALSRVWSDMTRLVQHTPVWELRRPRDWTWRRDLQTQLDAALAEARR